MLRFVRPFRVAARAPKACVRFKTPPGQQAQIDVGQGDWDALLAAQRLSASKTPQPKTAFWPSFRTMLVDSERRLWVEEFGRHGRIAVFEIDGASPGDVTLPSAEMRHPEFVNAEAGHVVIRTWNDAGAIRLHFHRVQSRSSAH